MRSCQCIVAFPRSKGDFKPYLHIGSQVRRQAGSAIAPETQRPPQNPRELGLCEGLLARGSGRSRTDDGGFAIRCLSHLATEPCAFCPTRYGSPGRLVKRGRAAEQFGPCRARRPFLPRPVHRPRSRTIFTFGRCGAECGRVRPTAVLCWSTQSPRNRRSRQVWQGRRRATSASSASP